MHRDGNTEGPFANVGVGRVQQAGGRIDCVECLVLSPKGMPVQFEPSAVESSRGMALMKRHAKFHPYLSLSHDVNATLEPFPLLNIHSVRLDEDTIA